MNRYNNNRMPRQAARGSILPLMLFFPLSLLFSELVTRISTYGGIKFRQFIYILLVSAAGGFVLSGVVGLIKNKKAVKIVSVIISAATFVVCAAHVVYFKIFLNYFEWGDIGMAGDAIGKYTAQFLKGMRDAIFPMLILLIPFVVLIVFNKRFAYYQYSAVFPKAPLSAGAAAAVCFTVFAFIVHGHTGYEGDLYFYNHPNNNETSLNFGVLTSSRLNIEKLLFGEKKDNVLPPETPGDNPIKPGKKDDQSSGSDTDGTGTSGTGTEEPSIPVEYGYNQLDIDFDTLINNAPNSTVKAMHEYFKKQTASKQNEYTGYFKGKNLIFLTLEGFSGKIIDPELTPTLHKMSTGGFVFENYYCSCWGGSTATGEYANLTGLFYNNVTCMTTYAGKNYWPFTLANQLNKDGYTSLAFHANSSTYYSRNLSLPSLGYKFIAGGTGIEDLTDSDGNSFRNNNKGHSYKESEHTIKPWPPSDEFTAQVTVNSFINKQPFNVYYMTISGHANYSWGGNSMSKLHRNEINEYCASKNLNYSEETKAYLACQLEVELMAKKLVDELDKAGILEDTVFVMAADHYPYGLSNSALSELYGLPEDGILKNFDLYRNTLIIWSASMKKTVTVDVPCSAIDILPTVSNLFGLKFDSRLLMGVDVFSDKDPLVILNCVSAPSWNWINRYGVYNSSSGFKLNPEYEMSDEDLKEYVKNMKSIALAKKNYAFMVVKNDYYSYLKNYLN